MATNEYLFEMEPYTERARHGQRKSMPPGVRTALARLRRTAENMPAEERDIRRRFWTMQKTR